MTGETIGVNPLAYWKGLRALAEPFELMKFSLTYQDDLPSTGNKPNPAEVARIRNCFHDQLFDLWESHVILRELARTARVPRITYMEETTDPEPDYSRFTLPDFKEPIPPLESGHIDLCAPIDTDTEKKQTKVAYRPLVRSTLGLSCALDILFLRQEEPGKLVLQSGDIDGRMKCLFDALRMPTRAEEDAGGITPAANPLQCLLESDSLITDFSIRTGRLLGVPPQKRSNRVHLIIDVMIKVLRFTIWNQCLIGD